MGGFTLREGVLGMAGPGSREIPLFGTLLAAAMLGGVAIPGLRRAVHAFRVTEQRVRMARIRNYITAAADQALPNRGE